MLVVVDFGPSAGAEFYLLRSRETREVGIIFWPTTVPIMDAGATKVKTFSQTTRFADIVTHYALPTSSTRREGCSKEAHSIEEYLFDD